MSETTKTRPDPKKWTEELRREAARESIDEASEATPEAEADTGSEEASGAPKERQERRGEPPVTD